jgi:RNA polymerase sigma-70 factor (ECF subfamily)
LTEKELIEKAKTGDKHAFAGLVSAYSDRIYNLGLRILRNKEDAEDILQESFLTVLEKLHTFDGRSSFFTWIYRIATNASLMKLRKKKPVYTDLSEDPANGQRFEEKILIDWSQNPLLDLQNKEIKKTLNDAIKELPEIYRTVFVLRDIEHLSIRETGQILDISEENVKIRLRRARLFLRDKITTFYEENVV